MALGVVLVSFLFFFEGASSFKIVDGFFFLFAKKEKVYEDRKPSIFFFLLGQSSFFERDFLPLKILTSSPRGMSIWGLYSNVLFAINMEYQFLMCYMITSISVFYLLVISYIKDHSIGGSSLIAFLIMALKL